MRVTSDLLKVLVCPVAKDKLIYDYQNSRLVSLKAKLAYPIIDGIPMLLEDQAIQIDDHELENLLKQKD